MIGLYLKEVRTAKFRSSLSFSNKITLKDVAEKVGITHAYLSNIETEKRYPAIETFFNIVEALSRLRSNTSDIPEDFSFPLKDTELFYLPELTSEDEEVNDVLCLNYAKKYFKRPIFYDELEEKTKFEDEEEFLQNYTKNNNKKNFDNLNELFEVDSQARTDFLDGLFYKYFDDGNFLLTYNERNEYEDNFQYYIYELNFEQTYLPHYKKEYADILNNQLVDFFYNKILNGIIARSNIKFDKLDEKENEIIKTIEILQKDNSSFKHYSYLSSQNLKDGTISISQVLRERLIAGINEKFDLDILLSESKNFTLYLDNQPLTFGERNTLITVLNGLIYNRQDE